MKKIVVVENVVGLVERNGIEKCCFLTLTFADDVKCSKEASRRFNSFRVALRSMGMLEYVCVQERHRSGRIHFHLVAAFDKDIRGKLTDKQILSGFWASANKALKDLWVALREKAKKYSFGRTNLKPLAGNGCSCGYYLAKYLTKSVRHEHDKGVRLVRFGLKVRTCSSKVTAIGSYWRKACVILFGDIDVRSYLGSRWCYLLKPAIDKMIRCLRDGINFSQSDIDSVRAFVYYGSSLFSFTGFHKRLMSRLDCNYG